MATALAGAADDGSGAAAFGEAVRLEERRVFEVALTFFDHRLALTSGKSRDHGKNT
jgi:hypothetical protein